MALKFEYSEYICLCNLIYVKNFKADLSLIFVWIFFFNESASKNALS